MGTPVTITNKFSKLPVLRARGLLTSGRLKQEVGLIVKGSLGSFTAQGETVK